jgi:two-component system, sensor histidine kinase and response regulator
MSSQCPLPSFGFEAPEASAVLSDHALIRSTLTVKIQAGKMSHVWAAGLRRVSEIRPKVLLVDDVEANLLALGRLLRSLDCELVRASSGSEALRLLAEQAFAVVLLDVQMPDMDGYEVATRARENPATRQVPILFVTALDETKAHVLRGYDSGAFDVLFKPIDPYILRSKVQIFLELHRSRRRLQVEIDAHQRTLAEVDAFNYSVSHDLRAPLRPLDGFSEALLEDYGHLLDDKAKDYLNRIRAAARRMGHLIEDLLELSRIGRLPVQRQPVDLSGLIASIVAELRASEPTRQVELDCQAHAEVAGDPRLLRMALQNLLQNAWKFTQRKPGARIEFASQPGAPAVFFIRDDGVGFDPAYAGRLFQPFQRLHSAADFEGTGIGLAIVDRIVRRHGGRIWAESTPAAGATFFFTLGSTPSVADAIGETSGAPSR